MTIRSQELTCKMLIFGFPLHSNILYYEKREVDVKSPATCAKFTLNQITKAY